MSGELPVPDYVRSRRDPQPSPSSSSSSVSAEPQETQTIPEQLQENPLGAEFLVGIFWSAANSFRHDSIVRPLPPMFVEGGAGSVEVVEGEGRKDIDGVVRDLSVR